MLKNSAFICAIALAGCGQFENPRNQVESPPVGRWTIVHSPHVQRDTMLLDTVTGNTWVLVRLGEKENSGYGWEFSERLDAPDTVSQPSN